MANVRQMRRLMNAFPNDPAVFTAAFTTLLPQMENQLLLLDNAAGFTVTLSKANGSGSYLTFLVLAAITSNSYIINRSGSDKITGVANVSFTANNTTGFHADSVAASGANTITLNGTTTGAKFRGDMIILQDIQPALWLCQAFLTSSGSATTPFS